jgi:hypothetical protein
MCANTYNPPNNFCSGATLIGTIPVTDNNACHKPSSEVSIESICAHSIENTAFYTYTTEFEGSSILTIGNIACDNSAFSGKGFQIGFFTGSCGALTPLQCYRDTGVLIQATTANIPANTHVLVAIDGMLGSNCTYTVSVTNGVALPATLKYFSSWKKTDANVLKWLTLNETPEMHFEIQKSLDGINYFKIGMLQGKNRTNTQTDYTFEDKTLLANQFYRLRLISGAGRGTYSNTIQVTRENLEAEMVAFRKTGADGILVQTSMLTERNAMIQIIDPAGRQMKLQGLRIDKGQNFYTVDIHSLARGFYYLIFRDNDSQRQFSFIKE